MIFDAGLSLPRATIANASIQQPVGRIEGLVDPLDRLGAAAGVQRRHDKRHGQHGEEGQQDHHEQQQHAAAPLWTRPAHVFHQFRQDGRDDPRHCRCHFGREFQTGGDPTRLNSEDRHIAGPAAEKAGHVQRFDQPQFVQGDGIALHGQQVVDSHTSDRPGFDAGLHGVDDDHFAAIGEDIDQIGPARAAIDQFHACRQVEFPHGFDGADSHALVAEQDVSNPEDEGRWNAGHHGCSRSSLLVDTITQLSSKPWVARPSFLRRATQMTKPTQTVYYPRGRTVCTEQARHGSNE